MMKEYLKPQCDLIDAEFTGVLCASSDFNDYTDGIYDGDGIETP